MRFPVFHFPWIYLLKIGEKGTIWENEQSIYGAVAGELNTLEEFSSVWWREGGPRLCRCGVSCDCMSVSHVLFSL